MSGTCVNTPTRRGPDIGSVAVAALFCGVLAHIWFASTPLLFAGPNVLLAALAVLLAALSVVQSVLSSKNLVDIRRRLRNVLPVLGVAALVSLWALAVYVATGTLDGTRVAKMALGIGVLFAVFACVDNLPRARAMAWVLVVAIAVSALYGFAVVWLGEPFLGWWLRIANVPQEDLQEMLLFGRNAGLAAHISTFGRQLAMAIPLALAALLYSDFFARRARARTVRLHRAALAFSFVLLMTLVTGMLMNASRSVLLCVVVVAAVVALPAVRSSRARRRFLVAAPLAAVWLFFYFHAQPTADRPDSAKQEASGVGGVRGDIQDLTVGPDALQTSDANAVGHEFVGKDPGAEYEVQLRERHTAGYGQPSVVTVRADTHGKFVLVWRKRPSVHVHQHRLRRVGAVGWPEWIPFQPSLGTDVSQQDPPVLQDVLAGQAWPADLSGQQRIGFRIHDLDPGSPYHVWLEALAVDGRGKWHQVAVTADENGTSLITWRPPRNIGIQGYAYRLSKPDQEWFFSQIVEPFLHVIAPPDATLPDVALGIHSLASRGGSTRTGHAFGGFVPWFWYVVQVRQLHDGDVVTTTEFTIKPDEGGTFTLTWAEPKVPSGIVGHQFRMRNISHDEWSPWQDFSPALSSRVPRLEMVPAGGKIAAPPAHGARVQRHTLEGLPPGIEYRGQLRARNEIGYGPPTRDAVISPDVNGSWIFAWREVSSGLATTGYQFRVWWPVKVRWRPWQDFVPADDGTGRTKVNFVGRLGTHEQNVATARTAQLFQLDTKKTTIYSRLLDSSAKTRLHEMATVLRYVGDHPWGTGVYAPQLVHVAQELDDWRKEEILHLWPHNQFLHVLALFGWPGFALLVIFYACVLRPVVRCAAYARRSGDSDLLFLAIGVVGAWAAYSMNSLFIPAGPFLEGWSHFYLIGLLFGVERLVMERRDLERASGTVPT